MWWGVLCAEKASGELQSTIGADDQQLKFHLTAIIARREASASVRDFSIETLKRVGSVLFPGLVPALLDLYGETSYRVSGVRSAWDYVRARVAPPAPEQARAVDPTTQAQAVADLVRAFTAGGLPFVVVIDDAHLADPVMVRCLDQIMTAPVPALVIACAWPEAIAQQRRADDRHTLGGLLNRFEEQGNAFTVTELDPLGREDLARIVRWHAEATDSAIVDALVDRASGNPLVLLGYLGLRAIRDSLVVADGARRLTPTMDEVRELPTEWAEVLEALWRELPVSVQDTLRVAAMQGRRAEANLTLAGSQILSNRTGQDDLESAVEPHRWLERVAAPLLDFRDPLRYDIARAPRHLPNRESACRIWSVWIDEILRRRADAGAWDAMSDEVRETHLRVLVEAATRLAREGQLDHDATQLYEACGELADAARERKHVEEELAARRQRRTLAHELHDGEEWVASEWEYASTCRDMRLYAEAAAALDAVIRFLRRGGQQPRALAGALIDRSTVHCDQCDWESALSPAREAVALIEEHEPGDVGGIINARLNLEIYLRCLGRHDEALAQQGAIAALLPSPEVGAEYRDYVELEQALTRTEAANGPDSQAALTATADLADNLFARECFAPAEYHLRRLVEHTPEEPRTAMRARAEAQLAVQQHRRGNDLDAVELLEHVVDDARAGRLGPELLSVLVDVLERVERGRDASAIREMIDGAGPGSVQPALREAL
jgi:hypothetical protein